MACPSGSGYPFQVLAPPSSGCGLSTSIPHAILPTVCSTASANNHGFTLVYLYVFVNLLVLLIKLTESEMFKTSVNTNVIDSSTLLGF